MTKYHEKYMLPHNTIIHNDLTSDKSLSEITDEMQNKLQQTIQDNKLFGIIGPHGAQLFDPKQLIIYDIQEVE